jgi:hypothetical protein
LREDVHREVNRRRSRAWREANLERSRRNVAAWKRQNRDRTYALIHRRLAWKAGTDDGGYTTVERLKARVEVHGSRCYYCGGPFEVYEHRIPLSRGGPHLPANIVPACNGCNLRKRSQTEREFVVA